MYKRGDIVAIATELLFFNFFDERSNLRYAPRDLIYGVITVCNGRGEYFVEWAIEGLFNITEVDKSVLQNQIYDQDDLDLIRSFDDTEIDDDLYIEFFST